MKTCLTIFLFFIFCFTRAQDDDKLKGKPKNLQETFKYLDQMLGDTVKYNFLVMPEDFATSKMQFTFGTYIRNSWGLWKGSDLNEYFLKRGISHPDNMSGIIFTSYHRYLNHKPIDLKEQINKVWRTYETMEVDTLEDGSVKISYPEMMKDRTSSEDILSYYPINDTILIYVGGEKGIFHKNTTIPAKAKIIDHTEDNNLLIDIFEIRSIKGVSTEYSVGDQVEGNPYYCYLIPKNNWKADLQTFSDEQLDSVFKEEEKHLEKYEISERNIYFLGGVYSGYHRYTGNNELLGGKVPLGLIGGLKLYKNYFNLLLDFKVGKPKEKYEVMYNDTLNTTDTYQGMYIGLEYTRDIITLNNIVCQGSIGYGYSWITAIQGKDKYGSDSKYITSDNLNFGLGIKYNINLYNYIALQGVYNHLAYKNKGGTDLSGDAITIKLIYGWK